MSPTRQIDPEEDVGTEGEDDLGPLKPIEISEAVVTASDWTTETILNQVRRHNIRLDPSFQRRDAWTPNRKSRFIESVFLGFPIPQIVLAEERGRRGHYIVIDGKQRLLSLVQFAASHDDEDFAPLLLTGLSILDRLNGSSLETLVDNGAFAEDVVAFQNQTIRTVVVKNWKSEDFLYTVFLRLNTGSVPLSPQELRRALKPGPFVDFAEAFSAESIPIQTALHLKKPDFRMRDVELLIRFFGFTCLLPKYDGNLKSFLDATCEALNAAWGERELELRQLAASCDRSIETTLAIFGGNAFHRWNGERFEGRFNRAVFDIMTYYFREGSVADEALGQGPLILEAFKELASTNDQFDASLSTTTKSIPATFIRLETWGKALSDILEGAVQVPSLTGSRIIP